MFEGGPSWGGVKLFAPLLVIILCLLFVCGFLGWRLWTLVRLKRQQDTLSRLNNEVNSATADESQALSSIQVS